MQHEINLQRSGDRITAVTRGKSRKVDIDTPADLKRALAAVNAGDELTVEVHRGEETVTVTVQPGKGL